MTSVTFFEIVVAGPNPAEVEKSLSQLALSGFASVCGVTSLGELKRTLNHCSCRLCYIDSTWRGDYDSGLRFVQSMLPSRPACNYVLITSDPSLKQFYIGALSGLRDYLVKSSSLNLGVESERLLGTCELTSRAPTACRSIDALGFFRSLGLTKREIEILVEYTRDFPRQRELSERLGKSLPQLRKVFSTIYGKLSRPLAVENCAQLAHLLTIAVFYPSVTPTLSKN